jgi:hypothetical protein
MEVVLRAHRRKGRTRRLSAGGQLETFFAAWPLMSAGSALDAVSLDSRDCHRNLHLLGRKIAGNLRRDSQSRATSKYPFSQLLDNVHKRNIHINRKSSHLKESLCIAKINKRLHGPLSASKALATSVYGTSTTGA